MRTDINDIVVYFCVNGLPGNMENARIAAVIFADVIADNRIRTPVSAVAGSADKHKTSIVIMTVVILKDGSITMVITIERLAVHSPHHAGNLIEQPHGHMPAA